MEYHTAKKNIKELLYATAQEISQIDVEKRYKHKKKIQTQGSTYHIIQFIACSKTEKKFVVNDMKMALFLTV